MPTLIRNGNGTRGVSHLGHASREEAAQTLYTIAAVVEAQRAELASLYNALSQGELFAETADTDDGVEGG